MRSALSILSHKPPPSSRELKTSKLLMSGRNQSANTGVYVKEVHISRVMVKKKEKKLRPADAFDSAAKLRGFHLFN